jgi:hypothetical protein
MGMVANAVTEWTTAWTASGVGSAMEVVKRAAAFVTWYHTPRCVRFGSRSCPYNAV